MKPRTAVVALALVAAACSGGDGARAADAEGSLTATARLGDELLGDGGFENGEASPSSWQLSTETPAQSAEWVEDDDGRYARLAAPIEEDAGWPMLLATESVPVSGGEDYLLSLSASTEDSGLLFVAVWFSNAAGESTIGIGPGTWTVDSETWTQFEHKVTAPDGAVSAEIIVRLALNASMTNATELSVLVDDISLRGVSE